MHALGRGHHSGHFGRTVDAQNWLWAEFVRCEAGKPMKDLEQGHVWCANSDSKEHENSSRHDSKERYAPKPGLLLEMLQVILGD